MIRQAKGCSPSEARRLLWAPAAAGEAHNRDPWAAAMLLPEKSEDDSVSDITKEDKAIDAGTMESDKGPIINSMSAGVLTVTPKSISLCAPRRGIREYHLDAAFSQQATQTQVYDKAARGVVADFLNGTSGGASRTKISYARLCFLLVM